MKIVLILLIALAKSLFAETHHPQEFLQAIKDHHDEGSKIYEHFCANCHAPEPLIQVGAPVLRKSKDWDARLQAGGATLLKHCFEGLNLMPARGGCFECSDRQLISAILYMLPSTTKSGIIEELKEYNKNK
jgi:cytochrome c5